MIAKLEQIMEYLNDCQDDITINNAYPVGVADAPLYDKCAYIRLENEEDSRFEFVIAVYYPILVDGRTCLLGAEALLRLLFNANCPANIETAKLGGVRFNRENRAFVCEISCTVSDVQAARYHVRAENFEYSDGVYIDVRLPGYKIERHYNITPIMTVFEGFPDGFSDGQNYYDITLTDFPVAFLDDLANKGAFDMTVENDDFTDCYCIKSVEKDIHNAEVLIRGWKRPEEEPERPDIPIAQ